MTVTLLAVDHRLVDEATRAALAIGPDGVDAALAQLATLHPGVEALLVATCARTELLLAGDGVEQAAATWHGLLAAAGGEDAPCGRAQRRVLTGAAAVRHVLRVAAGLDSPLLGDVDVLAQLRDAAARADAAGVLGRTLRDVVDRAIAVGRRARSTTPIAAGAPSIAGAVLAELAALAPRAEHVVVVGAGDAAHGVVAGLSPRIRLTVVNRTVGRAADLVAGRPEATAVGLDELASALTDADAVVVATAGGTVLDAATATAAGLVSRRVPVLDASAPAAVATVPGLVLRPLAALHARRDAAHATRAAAVPAVEALVEEALDGWRSVGDRAAIEGAIAALYREAPRVVAALTDAADAREVERTLRAFLHDHVTGLRAVSAAD